MDKGKRQKRLIQKVRNKTKWLKRVQSEVKKSGERFTIRDERRASIAANHGKLCSCGSCCNPRHSPYHKGEYLSTMQEKRADEKFHDED